MKYIYDIKNSIDLFLQSKNEDTGKTYIPKIQAFAAYLYDKKLYLNQREYLEKLNKIEPIDIENSMNYYIEESQKKAKALNNKNYEITSSSTLYLYLSVLQEYFRFLHRYGIRNSILLKKFTLSRKDPESFIHIIDKVRKKYNLSINELGMIPLTEYERNLLLEECDSTINTTNINDIFIGKCDTSYRYFLCSIILKLILYTGIKYEVLKTIKFSHYNQINGTLLINKYTLNLSKIDKIFYQQFNKYLDFRKCVLNQLSKSLSTNNFESISYNLFIPYKSKTSPYNNLYVTDFLSKIIDRYDTIGIGKYKILKIMNTNTPIFLISSLTGYKEQVLNACKEQYKMLYSKNYLEDYTVISKYANFFIKN